jgi:uncharacterized protein
MRRFALGSGGLHPGGAGGATGLLGFVVGPEGELYRCWNDVGRPERVVGDVRAEEAVIGSVLQARYATGVDPYDDPECRACAVLPICGGGCAHRRLLVKYAGREDVDSCSPYKTRLQESLEAYVDAKRSQETCAGLLRPGTAEEERPAWRVISPTLKQTLKAQIEAGGG